MWSGFLATWVLHDHPINMYYSISVYLWDKLWLSNIVLYQARPKWIHNIMFEWKWFKKSFQLNLPFDAGSEGHKNDREEKAAETFNILLLELSS